MTTPLHELSPEELLLEFSNLIEKDKKLNYDQLPGFSKLLRDEYDPDIEVTPEDFARRTLKALRDTGDETEGEDYDYLQGMLADYTSNQQSSLNKFIDGTPIGEVAAGLEVGPTQGTRLALEEMHHAPSVPLSSLIASEAPAEAPAEANSTHHLMFWSHDKAEFDLFEDDEKKSPINVSVDAIFKNWGRTVENKPQYTYVPRTAHGVQQIVKFAAAKGLPVRAAGYRHSWAPAFGRDKGGVLISTVNLHTATKIPNLASLSFLPLNWDNPKPGDLTDISFVKPESIKPGQKALVRVGCAVTNELLRLWCLAKKLVTLPMNVIMVEITLGGSNAPICHGAGIKTRTLSDLVRGIEYVDAHGNLQKIGPEDKEFLLTAAGCFGLIGVITHLVLEFDPMSYAELLPVKVPVVEAVPPPSEEYWNKLPPALKPKRSYTDADKKKLQEDFERRANDDYYSEWFWFPYSNQVWVNTWKNTDDPNGKIDDWPGKLAVGAQFVEAITMQGFQEIGEVVGRSRIPQIGLAKGLPMFVTNLISKFAMKVLPSGTRIKTPLPNGLHFRRAIQNTRVRDVELEIPLTTKHDSPSTVDYTTVQRAWWDAINLVYSKENVKTCPMQMPLEMRIMGGSDVIMAPQLGNVHGTCAIEVLTLEASAAKWPKFAQDVLDLWMSYVDPQTGKRLKTRPHWAKEWHQFKVDQKPFIEYLKNVSYKDEIPIFKDTLRRIGKAHGWTLEDIQQRFSNDLYDDLIFDIKTTGAVIGSTVKGEVKGH